MAGPMPSSHSGRAQPDDCSLHPILRYRRHSAARRAFLRRAPGRPRPLRGPARGEFCYVLTSRQMGKSSLMAHTAARLRAAGIAVVNLDLTRLGQNLTVEQWYDGLLGRMGRQLDLEDELEEYWEDHERLSPLQRWLGALQEVVLPAGAGPAGDLHRRDRRGAQPAVLHGRVLRRDPRVLQPPQPRTRSSTRLTFCLLGVATPSDLIRDTRTTPFNIGRRIELGDFPCAEAAPLAIGLGARQQDRARRCCERVLYWTGGHPYLTQRLCQAVARRPGASRSQRAWIGSARRCSSRRAPGRRTTTCCSCGSGC